MEVEHDIKVIPLTPNLQAELERLTKEGWILVPGVQPIAIYHVVRQKAATAQANTAIGTMMIDESKVQILRNGQLIG